MECKNAAAEANDRGTRGQGDWDEEIIDADGDTLGGPQHQRVAARVAHQRGNSLSL